MQQVEKIDFLLKRAQNLWITFTNGYFLNPKYIGKWHCLEVLKNDQVKKIGEIMWKDRNFSLLLMMFPMKAKTCKTFYCTRGFVNKSNEKTFDDLSQLKKKHIPPIPNQIQECYSYQPKKTSTHDWRRHGQLSIGSRSYGSRT